MKTLKTIVITVIVCALLFGVGVLVLKKQGPTAEMLVERFALADIGELNTSELLFTIVEEYEGDAKKIFNLELPRTTPKLTYSVEGYVKAGIDFARIGVVINDKKVVVTMPKASITETYIDLSTMKVFQETKGLFNSVRANDQAAAQLELEKKAQELAVEKGILTSADKNAETIVREMIVKVTGDEYEIAFRY